MTILAGQVFLDEIDPSGLMTRKTAALELLPQEFQIIRNCNSCIFLSLDGLGFGAVANDKAEKSS